MFENLLNKTIVGIGIDLVSVEKIAEMQKITKGSFYKRTFTERERNDAALAQDETTYLAGRFAVKEAVFKAIAHLHPSKQFDFRIVETLKNDDGSPYINKSVALQKIMDEAKVKDLFVSISNEDGYAIAIVHAI